MQLKYVQQQADMTSSIQGILENIEIATCSDDSTSDIKKVVSDVKTIASNNIAMANGNAGWTAGQPAWRKSYTPMGQGGYRMPILKIQLLKL